MRTVFLLGTSHVGKSSCAQALSEKWGVDCVSTDKLGRHPGRPWNDVPRGVVEYYTKMSAETIDWFLKVHHQNLQPVISQAVAELRASGKNGVIEGAALRPEWLDQWMQAQDCAICLVGDEDTLRARMRQSAGVQIGDVQQATEAFIERSLRENARLAEAACARGVPVLDVSVLSLRDAVDHISARVTANGD